MIPLPGPGTKRNVGGLALAESFRPGLPEPEEAEQQEPLGARQAGSRLPLPRSWSPRRPPRLLRRLREEEEAEASRLPS